MQFVKLFQRPQRMNGLRISTYGRRRYAYSLALKKQKCFQCVRTQSIDDSIAKSDVYLCIPYPCFHCVNVLLYTHSDGNAEVCWIIDLCKTSKRIGLGRPSARSVDDITAASVWNETRLQAPATMRPVHSTALYTARRSEGKRRANPGHVTTSPSDHGLLPPRSDPRHCLSAGVLSDRILSWKAVDEFTNYRSTPLLAAMLDIILYTRIFCDHGAH